MTENDTHPRGLVKIEITADDREAARTAAERIVGLWLASSISTRPVPDQEFRAVIHADIDRSPAEGDRPDAYPLRGQE
ncbi:hypothetical protein ACFC0D_03180 [Streptomyces sp. NPDC056222]|uniref:hypothetical protein n=1 Tax=Streptomyces sp. NPDC056222 TaxID=3345749 RepID=UPI0035E2C48C